MRAVSLIYYAIAFACVPRARRLCAVHAACTLVMLGLAIAATLAPSAYLWAALFIPVVVLESEQQILIPLAVPGALLPVHAERAAERAGAWLGRFGLWVGGFASPLSPMRMGWALPQALMPKFTHARPAVVHHGYDPGIAHRPQSP